MYALLLSYDMGEVGERSEASTMEEVKKLIVEGPFMCCEMLRVSTPGPSTPGLATTPWCVFLLWNRFVCHYERMCRRDGAISDNGRQKEI